MNPEKIIIERDICTPMFIAALFTIARARKMLIDKRRDTEIVVYMCNGILLNYKKNAFESPNEVDEPRAYYTKWSKTERDTFCILMHVYGI